MTVSIDLWQARAAACELLALSFRYPDDLVLADAIASGEWAEAATEIAEALGLNLTAASAGVGEMMNAADSDDIRKELRLEATRLFVGPPEGVCSPYEGICRARAEGVPALLYVNPHAMAVERFCKACGFGRPEGTNEPLDTVWTELELLECLAVRAAVEVAGETAEVAVETDAEAGVETAAISEATPATDVSAEAADEEPGAGVLLQDLPGGSAVAAWDLFINAHTKPWMPTFAEAVQRDSRVPFYKQAAGLLGAFIASV